MAKPKDYYELLGVERSASSDQIRSAYRKLARKYHPDVNKAADASKRFAEVQEAYDVLSDPEKRKSYDQFGHAGVGAGPRTSGGGPGGPGSGPGAGYGGEGFYRGGPQSWTHVESSGFDDVDVESIFEQMFGGGGGPSASGRSGRSRSSPFGAGTRGRPRAQPERGSDIEHTIAITFMTAALGGTEHLRLGPADGSGEPQTISVKVPPGIDAGAKLRVRGKGQQGTGGGQIGDLILTVQVGQHPYFRREGLDLLVDIPITIAEAARGVKVTAPLLKGTIDIKIPGGASSGRRLRVRGKGIVDSKGKAGDYFAVIQIVAPDASELSKAANAAIDQIAAELKNPRESAPWADDRGPHPH
jgi:DnaJ-class molecular chaperone